MTGKILKTCAIGAFVIGSLVLITQDALAAASFRKVVLTGESAPGTDPGVVFNSFEKPVLNMIGQVAFVSELSGPGVVAGSNDRAIWTGQPGSVGMVARLGEIAPGSSPSSVFTSFIGFPALNNSGQVVFLGTHIEPSVTSVPDGIWLGSSNSLFRVASKGTNAFGSRGQFTFFPALPAIDDTGQVTFLSILTGTGIDSNNNAGIWTVGPGAFNLRVKSNDTVQDSTTGGTLNFAFNQMASFNQAGQYALIARLFGPGIVTTNDLGIVSGSSTGPVLITRKGLPAPGLGGAEVFGNFFSQPVINEAGQSAFKAALSGPTVDFTNNDSLWLYDGNALRMVAREGDAAPGTEPDTVFSTIGTHILNQAGQIAFQSQLAGPSGSGLDATNDSGIWMDRDGVLQLIVREGDRPPATAIGTAFAGLGRPKLNNIGQIIFESFLTGPGVDVTNNQGVWLADTDGNLTLITQKGDQIDVNDDPLIQDLRTINFIDGINVFGTSEERFVNFNDSGQLVLSLGFTDGTKGIFIATIPEPGTLGVFAVGGLWVLRRCG